MSEPQSARNPSAFVAGVVARLQESKRKVQARWDNMVRAIAIGHNVPDSEILETMQAAQRTPEDLQFDVGAVERVEQARTVIQTRPQFEQRQRVCFEAVTANDARYRSTIENARTQHETERVRLEKEQQEITLGLEQIRLADVLLSAHDSDYSKRKTLLERIEQAQEKVNWFKEKILELEGQRRLFAETKSVGRVSSLTTEIEALKEQLEAHAKLLVLDLDSLDEPTGERKGIAPEDVAARVARKRVELQRRLECLDSLEARAATSAQRAATPGITSDERECSQRVSASFRQMAASEKKRVIALQREILELESLVV